MAGDVMVQEPLREALYPNPGVPPRARRPGAVASLGGQHPVGVRIATLKERVENAARVGRQPLPGGNDEPTVGCRAGSHINRSEQL
ncbi:hypothetical protein MPUL_43160 [Mycolicibacterium pulveris]|uniref:Uncharacterized protein n=1 Tax=Mycolicibacterium pulveris TaxID=36813 RepID=A0A7I7UP43_MYCPV|nr:hypothetical protein MPUL_43160 [Mycolicibacterium pulveris]